MLGECKDIERSLQRLHTQTGGKNDFSTVVLTLGYAMDLKAYLEPLNVLGPVLVRMGDFNELVKKLTAIFSGEEVEGDDMGLVSVGQNKKLDKMRKKYLLLLERQEEIRIQIYNELSRANLI